MTPETTTTTILRLSRLCPGQTGWAGTRRNIHPLTPILVINHPLSIFYDPWHPPYSTYVPDSLVPRSLSTSLGLMCCIYLQLSGGMLAWLSVWVVWGEVQICIWLSWCHCHSLSLAPVNPDWFYPPGFTFLVSAYACGPDKMVLIVYVTPSFLWSLKTCRQKFSLCTCLSVCCRCICYMYMSVCLSVCLSVTDISAMCTCPSICLF